MTDLEISSSVRPASREMMEPRLRLKLELLFVTGQQMHVRVAVPCSVAGQEWGGVGWGGGHGGVEAAGWEGQGA